MKRGVNIGQRAREEGVGVVLEEVPPAEVKKPKKKMRKSLPGEGRGEIIPGKRREREEKMAGITVETLEIGQLVKPSVEAPRTVGEKAELPAFLEGDELPEGYERILAQQKVVVRPTKEGIICYDGPVGVVLTEVDGKYYLRFLGLKLPEKAHYDLFDYGVKDSIPIPSEGLLIEEGSPLWLHGDYIGKVGVLKSRRKIGVTIPMLDADFSLYDEHRVRKLGTPAVQFTRKESVGVEIVSLVDGGPELTVPSEAMVRPAGAGASLGEAREGGAEAEGQMAGVPGKVEAATEAAEWKKSLEIRGNELVTALGEYGKEESLAHLVDLLRVFTNLGVDVYLKGPKGTGEKEFGQQVQAFDGAAEVMIGYFRQILSGSNSLVFNPLLKTYDDTVGWSNHVELYFNQAVAFDKLLSESAKEGQKDYAILGAAALTRVGQLVFSRIPEGAKVDIGELRKLYQEAVERYLSRLTSISK